MNDVDIVEYERRAIAGEWRAAVTILSRASVNPDVLKALMTPEAHDEVRLAIAMRPDLTPGQTDWIASTTDSTFVLNRMVAHGKAATNTLRDIRSRALEESGETWRMLAEYATGTLERGGRETGLRGAF